MLFLLLPWPGVRARFSRAVTAMAAEVDWEEDGWPEVSNMSAFERADGPAREGFGERSLTRRPLEVFSVSLESTVLKWSSSLRRSKPLFRLLDPAS